MHTKGGFRHKSAIFADFNETKIMHTGRGKKEMKSKNHDFIGKNRDTGWADRGNRVGLAGKQDGIVSKA